MSTRLFIVFMALGTIVCLVTAGFIITSNDPDTSGLATLFFFYLSLSLALFGLCSVLGFSIRKSVIKDDSALLRHVPAVFRQGILLSGAVIISLILASYRVLTWWNACLLGIFILMIEIIIFTNRKFRNTDYVQ